MKLHMYFSLRYLRLLLVYTLLLFSLFCLLELERHLRIYGDSPFSSNLGLASMRALDWAYDLLPLMAVFASLSLLYGLARHNELVVTRSAGRPLFTALLGPVTMSFAAGVLAVAAINPIVSLAARQYEALTHTQQPGINSIFSIGGETLWLRQASGDGQIVIQAKKFDNTLSQFSDTIFYLLNAQGVSSGTYIAKTANLVDGTWQLQDGKRWDFSAGVNPEDEAQAFDVMSIPTELTREEILEGLNSPETISIWRLLPFITKLRAAGFKASEHQMKLHSELARPFLLAAMVLIGAVLMLRQPRFGGVAPKILLTVLVGFGIFLAGKLLDILGGGNQIPPAAAAWILPVTMILFSVVLLLHLEDG